MDWSGKRTSAKEITDQLYVYSLHIAGFLKWSKGFFFSIDRCPAELVQPVGQLLVLVRVQMGISVKCRLY